MIPISPINETTVMPCIGQPVCAVLRDGVCHYGILRGIGDGNIYLDGMGGDVALASLPNKNKKNTKSDKVNTTAFLGYGGFGGFGFGGLALGLGLLTALFLLPWFWI